MSNVMVDMKSMEPIKPKTDSIMMSMKKTELIEYIRILEQNYNDAISLSDQQARDIARLKVDTGGISDREIVALKAVMRGCENNTKIRTSTYVSNRGLKISIERAIAVVRMLIARLEGGV